MSLSKIVSLTLISAIVPTGLAFADDSNSASGKSVYEASCKSCHSGGIGGWFSGAPKTGDKEAWVPLIDKGLVALIASSVNGFGDMSPKGGCETCSDDDVAAAAKYMVEQSR